MRWRQLLWYCLSILSEGCHHFKSLVLPHICCIGRKCWDTWKIPKWHKPFHQILNLNESVNHVYLIRSVKSSWFLNFWKILSFWHKIVADTFQSTQIFTKRPSIFVTLPMWEGYKTQSFNSIILFAELIIFNCI